MRPTLYVFLRHGESTANVAGRLSGWEDVALTARGEEQARAAADALRAIEETHGVTLGRLLVSDLGRARRTAELAAGARGLPTHVLADLRERHMGALQGESIEGLREDGRHAAYLQPWTIGPPGGESHAVSSRRALATLRAWHDGTPTLVVAHGALLRNVVGLLDGRDPESVGRGRAASHAEPIARWVEAWPARE